MKNHLQWVVYTVALSFFATNGIQGQLVQPLTQTEVAKPKPSEKDPQRKEEKKTSSPSISVSKSNEGLSPKKEEKKNLLEPFTGRVKKNKVRLRLTPKYDGVVIRELNSQELVVVVGEVEDFYVVKPLEDIKGYIFRTYVLDGVVEGNRVNVRLTPDLEGVVLAQLNGGDKVVGHPAPHQPKWIEIDLPPQVHFYIAKEYIERAGDPGLKERIAHRKKEVSTLLDRTEVLVKKELEKPFDQVGLESLKAHYQHVINAYSDFPEAVSKAKSALSALQDAYLLKKVAFLEQEQQHAVAMREQAEQLKQQLEMEKNKLAETKVHPLRGNVGSVTSQELPAHMTRWEPIEHELYNQWANQTGQNNPDTFYQQESARGFILKGIIEPYQRIVKNRPGDYMLVNSVTRLPVAFLYSTRVNLQDHVGREVSIHVVERDNHHYAFPAYFVLSLEK